MREVNVPVYLGGDATGGENLIWLRTPGPVADDPFLHQCILAYATDFSLIDEPAIEPLSASDPLWTGDLPTEERPTEEITATEIVMVAEEAVLEEPPSESSDHPLETPMPKLKKRQRRRSLLGDKKKPGSDEGGSK